MKIGVCGLGLGYSLSYYLAIKGFNVVGVDINPDTFEKPNPKLDDEMKKYIKDNYVEHYTNLQFTTSHQAFENCEYIFIFVATPMINRRLSMKYVTNALKTCAAVNNKATYLMLSTLPVGGMKKIRQTFPNIRIFYTPPMVRQRSFLSTFMNPPSGWQLIGCQHEEAQDVVLLYKKLLLPSVTIIVTNEQIVEAAKLVTNAILAAKIICANTIGSWLKDEALAKKVCTIVSMDPRIGVGYFSPGGPAAGPCFPRDLIELEEASKGSDLEELLKTMNKLNKTEELL